MSQSASSGANIKAGTVYCLLRGGITFSTPPTNGTQLLADATSNSSCLYPQAEDERKSRRTAGCTALSELSFYTETHTIQLKNAAKRLHFYCCAKFGLGQSHLL
ncbi:hypothetical protein O9992_19540 [Vibrio lentus]|nr:hypothetical protein [Vibrio lentus]